MTMGELLSLRSEYQLGDQESSCLFPTSELGTDSSDKTHWLWRRSLGTQESMGNWTPGYLLRSGISSACYSNTGETEKHYCLSNYCPVPKAKLVCCRGRYTVCCLVVACPYASAFLSFAVRKSSLGWCPQYL